MYSTCLFCNESLGTNEAIEHFPVGRRLAFDAGKGRLWVVCRRCERWNLTPLEERWEAIEACEREFRATKLRVSTDEIGLARLKEGLELVRIGAPQRPEMAAWRYGDQFGRRRRRYYALAAGGVAVLGTVIVAGPGLGLVSAGAVQPLIQLANAGRAAYRSRKVIGVTGPDGATLPTRLEDLDRVRLSVEQDDFVLRVPVRRKQGTAWWRYDNQRTMVDLTGEPAIRAAGALLPHLNRQGGSARDVQRAVEYLEEAESPDKLFHAAAVAVRKASADTLFTPRQRDLLKRLPTAGRLALEMASHEETERRALEGELHILEAAWRDAEEIAGIADNLFVPESVESELARLKRERDEGRA